MQKITDAFNLKFLSACGECGDKNEVDYFDYFASIFITCLQCNARTTFKEPVDPSIFGEMPFYKRKFIDGHFKLLQQLTISGIDFSQDITEEKIVFFDYDWDFANALVDIYTSYETFLYELTFKKSKELVANGKKIKDSPKFNDTIRELVENINSSKNSEANIILEGIENEFRVKDCRILLEEIGAINKKEFSFSYRLQPIRNNIVHRGNKANFNEYADAFINIGKIFNAYPL